ncbi:MerR family transcriptional regulator [Erysipelothrix inopinata]|uniref:MerR family transcriptional regulator n=1 Tax=Erysipelothrix inopinata TaxID=225084 RepID=A0A7G9RYE3_9FIRM|nr:MerR family transcriptional regulator [Erysipelothrix inopinata]QNN60618.1 MerR family transcriptional regulator [Erysipelothrix inopinata]
MKFYTIGETAKKAGITTETLRHYDRIGILVPSKTDSETRYRYYSDQDLVILTAILSLQQMDISLARIKEVLEYDNFNDVIAFMNEAEAKAEEKIKLLNESREKISRAKADFIEKAKKYVRADQAIEINYPKRVLLLSDTDDVPNLNNLENYHASFYAQLGPDFSDKFKFENIAGLYLNKNETKLFTVCERYDETIPLVVVPSGIYLCMESNPDTVDQVTQYLVEKVRRDYNYKSKIVIQEVMVVGILKWQYLVQVYSGKAM